MDSSETRFYLEPFKTRYYSVDAEICQCVPAGRCILNPRNNRPSPSIITLSPARIRVLLAILATVWICRCATSPHFRDVVGCL